MYVAADLDAATTRLEADLGLSAAGGGRHEGHGTVNRILPLGGGYLEVMSIADSAEAERSVLGRAVQTRLETAGDGLFAWSVAVDDLVAVAGRLGLSVSTIAREGLSARLAGLEESLRAPYLPFFITRDSGVEDPGAGGDAGGITWIEVAGDRERLALWIGDADLPVRVVDGPAGVHALGIGDRELRAS